MKAKPCPKCSSVNYISAWSFFKSGGATSVLFGSPFRLVSQLVKSFKNVVIDGMTSGYLIMCDSCKSYIVPCPHCQEFILTGKYINSGEIFECSKCKGKMSISVTEDSVYDFMRF